MRFKEEKDNSSFNTAQTENYKNTDVLHIMSKYLTKFIYVCNFSLYFFSIFNNKSRVLATRQLLHPYHTKFTLELNITIIFCTYFGLHNHSRLWSCQARQKTQTFNNRQVLIDILKWSKAYLKFISAFSAKQ